MASKTKPTAKSYVVAVKDYEKTMQEIAEGKLYVFQYKDLYPEILNNCLSKATDLKDVRKFIRQTKQSKKDVNHYWESLVTNGYSLFHVIYEQETPSIEILFNNNILKFVSKIF